MSKIYNKIGSLSALKKKLVDNNIHDFKSLREVIDFQESYYTVRQQLITHHEKLIEQEKNNLNIEIQKLDIEIETVKKQIETEFANEIEKLKQQVEIYTENRSKNILTKITTNIKKRNCKKQLHKIENSVDIEVKNAISNLVDIRDNKKARYQFIVLNFELAVKQNCRTELLEIERKKSVIDNSRSFIYGAIGEQKVIKTLEALSDDYYIINDFAISFSPAIYYKQENDYIYSIQIDHLLVAPSGIFLLETKNWSNKSIENTTLRSPVQQIKRTSYVLFLLLHKGISNYQLNLDYHHWGNKKIQIKNLIVLTKTKPKEEFQYVKVLTVDELINYISYFKPIFSSVETQSIAEYLLKINDGKILNPSD